MRSNSVNAMTNEWSDAESLREHARALIGRAIGFRNCSAPLLDELVAACQMRSFRRGNFVVRQADAQVHAGMVVSGVLDASVMQVDGHRHLVGLMLPGDFYGLLGAVDGLGHAHDLTVREDTISLIVPMQALREMRAREPSIVAACERQLAFRQRINYERQASDNALPTERRVATMLMMLASLHGRPEGDGIHLDVKLSQADMADWLGLSRQRVNYVLRRFARLGLIRLFYASLIIVDPEALQARARA